MRPLLLLAGFTTLVAASVFDLPANFDRFAPINPGFSWWACGHKRDRQCSGFEVPMDYKNKLAGKATLWVVKYPATAKGTKRGTLFVNPGGPGRSGAGYVFGGDAEELSKAVQGKYDIIGWDPRGVGSTIPRVDCFDTKWGENSFWEGTISRAGLEARGNFTQADDLKAFFDQVPHVDRLLGSLGVKCSDQSPDIMQYVGTAAAVRDMMSMNAYLDDPNKPINYWGLSYGTVIGMYLINMFPEHVGHVILDGVVDPVYWANKPPHKIWAINAESPDKALAGFVTACARAGPDHCAFTSKGSTAADLDEKIRNLLDLVYDYRKKQGKNAMFGSAFIRNRLFHAMYGPESWPGLAQSLQTCWKAFNNVPGSSILACESSTPWEPKIAPFRSDPPDYSFQAITCGDAVDAGGVTTQMVFQEMVDVTREVSHMFGPMWGIGGFYCHRWPVRAVERYTGPWTGLSVRNKVIVIGNEADPITPFRSAKRVADMLGSNAMLIEQKGFGHTSFAMHSQCTLDLIRKYFMDELTDWNTKTCQTDRPIFPTVTTSMLTALLSNSSIANSYSPETDSSKPQPSTRRSFATILAPICSVMILLILLLKSSIFKPHGKKHEPVMVADEEKGPVSSMLHLERKEKLTEL